MQFFRSIGILVYIMKISMSIRLFIRYIFLFFAVAISTLMSIFVDPTFAQDSKDTRIAPTVELNDRPTGDANKNTMVNEFTKNFDGYFIKGTKG